MTTPTPGGLNVPFDKHTLANGMRVIFSPDNAVPVVTVYIVYGVGARDEERAAPASHTCSST